MMAHRIKRALAFAILLFSITFMGAAMVFARPEPFFTYSRSYENITVYDTEPIPAVADSYLQDIVERLSLVPFEQDDMSLFVARDGWRHALFFALVPEAGGVVYYPVTHRHGFLAGADFERGLLKKEDVIVRPPRTLAYYGSHELSHLIIAKELGPLRYHSLPTWVSEGLAEYYALGAPADYTVIDRMIGDDPISPLSRDLYGAYPRYRLVVSWLLEHEDWDVGQLLATDMTLSEAVDTMRAGLYQ